MKEILIKINKREIFDDVSLSTAYAGAKGDGETGMFERVAAVEDDEALLSKFWLESCGEITEILKEFIVESQTDESLELKLELSGAYDESLTPSVVNDIRGALTAGITARWFRYTYAAKSEEFFSEASRLMGRIISKVCHRKRPVRNYESAKSKVQSAQL